MNWKLIRAEFQVHRLELKNKLATVASDLSKDLLSLKYDLGSKYQNWLSVWDKCLIESKFWLFDIDFLNMVGHLILGHHKLFSKLSGLIKNSMFR